MGRTITIRDGRVGAEGRRGEDYSVIGRDGSLHLPQDVLRVHTAGTLLRVELQPDGTMLLVPSGHVDTPDQPLQANNDVAQYGSLFTREVR
jgi:putative ABC transport system ATP-binding protein